MERKLSKNGTKNVCGICSGHPRLSSVVRGTSVVASLGAVFLHGDPSCGFVPFYVTSPFVDVFVGCNEQCFDDFSPLFL